MLIDMGKYLDEYDPNYRALSPESVQQWGFYNGGEYAIAQQRFAPSVVSNVLYVRQDWLDKLGMGISTTEEEFLEVLCAFTEDDPDGNGVNDTYGWCMTTAAKTTLHAVNKSSDRWYKQEDGTFQYRDMSGAKMKTIQMMEKLSITAGAARNCEGMIARMTEHLRTRSQILLLRCGLSVQWSAYGKEDAPENALFLSVYASCICSIV